MKTIIFVIVFTALIVFSCRTVNSTEKTNAENISMENTSKIIGRVVIFGNEPRTDVGIVDTDGIEYAVFPRSVGNELRQLQGNLIEFTVILLDEPQIVGFRGGTVTPIKWEFRQSP